MFFPSFFVFCRSPLSHIHDNGPWGSQVHLVVNHFLFDILLLNLIMINTIKLKYYFNRKKNFFNPIKKGFQ